jgi:pectinesterase
MRVLMLLLCGLVAAAGATGERHVVVAQDGSGDFPTIQRAVDHALDNAPADRGRLVIEIRPGVYKERVIVPPDMPRVTFLGKDAKTTVITSNMSAKVAGGTFLSATVTVYSGGFEAENITFENTFGPGSQAVALTLYSDRAVLRRCRFLGWQDTLYAAAGRQYYEDDYIAGAIDFMFGNAAAVFDHCEIHSSGPGYVTAQSRTLADGPQGFVFQHCRLTAEPGLKNIPLGRPWRNYSRVLYIDCWMGDHISPAGWNNWGKPEAEKTAWYGEFGSEGPGASQGDRLAWAHKMTAAEAEIFKPEIFLRGSDGWNPAAVHL